MKKALIIIAVIIAVLLLIALGIGGWVKTTYNSLVTLDEAVNGYWAQVENVLQRRYDLIPNLVETVRGYASLESEVLTRVTEARSRVGGAGTPSDRIQAEGELSSALSRLLMVVENYPQLKANQNFIMLQDQLEGTENRISVARTRYNDAARVLNSYSRQFFGSFFCRSAGVEGVAYFEATEQAKTEVPKVQF